MREIVPNMAGSWFWASSLNPKPADGAFAFSGFIGCISYVSRLNELSVRCVAGR